MDSKIIYIGLGVLLLIIIIIVTYFLTRKNTAISEEEATKALVTTTQPPTTRPPTTRPPTTQPPTTRPPTTQPPTTQPPEPTRQLTNTEANLNKIIQNSLDMNDMDSYNLYIDALTAATYAADSLPPCDSLECEDAANAAAISVLAASPIINISTLGAQVGANIIITDTEFCINGTCNNKNDITNILRVLFDFIY